mmetsp:Transcript_44841/g.116105  ORF Transcript_44841/g.116105 Transcript_44841/m.116105 type:complete len:90 (+) Transcript_44841:266-535(+)
MEQSAVTQAVPIRVEVSSRESSKESFQLGLVIACARGLGTPLPLSASSDVLEACIAPIPVFSARYPSPLRPVHCLAPQLAAARHHSAPP